MEALLNPTAARPRLTSDQLRAPFHDALKPPSAFRVGTEAEKFGLLLGTGGGTPSPLPYEGERSVSAVLHELSTRFGWKPEREYEGGAIIALTRGEASITLEPGAQLELSGAPLASIHDTQAEWVQHIDELTQVGEALGITWLGLGFHPFASQAELPWVPKLRYAVMREYLPTRGAMGLDMMRRTCTVQSNLDYASEADAMQKMRVALALSPIFTAMFANSPLYEGKLGGERTRRGLVWLNMDPDRTGLLPFLWRADASFDRYIEWALDVPMFLVKRGGKILRNTGQTFRAFMRDGYDGTHATEADWMMHLGTLFPEVRLKKTIEIRGVDAQPFGLLSALPALSKGLFYDPATLQKAEHLAERLGFEAVQGARLELARRGLAAEFAGRPALDWAREVVALGRAGLEAIARRENDPRGSEAVYLEPLEALLAHGQTPADALLAALDPSQPLTPQVLAHARLSTR